MTAWLGLAFAVVETVEAGQFDFQLTAWRVINETRMARYVIKRDQSSLPERLTRYKSELNEEQFAVVTAQPKATLVVAGAGTGKTRAITYRVAYLIEQGVSPQRILLATFTNRASREMLRRVESLTGSQNVHRVWGGTFHRIANLILRRHATSLGYDQNYSILDSEDARDFVNVCIDEAAIDTKAKRFPKAEVVQDIISYANNTDLPLENVIAGKYPYFEMLAPQIKRVDAIYQSRKVERNVMDYDDLLLKLKQLLVEKKEIAELYAEQFQHILVDEYQDTNRLQAEVIDLLAVKHRNVMVVGDDAQSIFAWRGAEFTNIYEFPKRYPEAQLFKLETNYRSTPEILGLANVSIANNRRQFPKMLKAVKRSRDIRPALVPCSDVEQQSAFIASRILELRDEGTSLEDIAVMYRSHYHSIELQLELSRRNIPYRVQSGVRFFEQAHIKDVISYLRVIVNPRDELAWKRILKLLPGVGNVTANRVFEAIALSDAVKLRAGDAETYGLVRGSVSGITGAVAAIKQAVQVSKGARKGLEDLIVLLETLVSDEFRDRPARQITHIFENGYEQFLLENFENAEARSEDIRGLAQFAQRYETTEGLLSELALLATERFKEPQPLVGEEVIEGGEDDELLTLTSVHQAKGLEWKAVFIIWAAEGKFPSPRSLREIDAEEEERRLWYVALTRAKDELYITYPLLMTDYNRQTVLQKPSRFVSECPPALFEIWDLEDESPTVDGPQLAAAATPSEYLN
ncbi:MAG TPA: ATP-dependent helicase [Pyrinomonadaceae bacterium]|nr:ATP-dependent helicase [Pyrinomonadaceae bacterium]HRK51264.1 ATP-dependent helicase [Pyrinomonadaceae bacterium]